MSTLKLKIKNSSLYIQARVRKAGSMSLVLQPTSDTEATVIGFGRVGGATVELICLDDAKMLKIVGLKFLKSGI